MANNTIRRSWNMYSMVNIEDLRGSAFQAEDGGHTFEITGLDASGNATPISGTVAAVFLRPDNTDVAISGFINNGKAYVTLTDECYGYPGRFGLTIFLTSNGQKVAIYAAIGNVHRTTSGSVSPETAADVVDLINEIEAAIAQIPSSYTNIMAAIAPIYSNTALYSEGAYAWYEGELYRCIVAITTAESWTSTHWTKASLANDVSAFIATERFIKTHLPATEKATLQADGGIYINSGYSTNYCVSDFLSVNVLKLYVVQNAMSWKAANACTIAFYDRSKTPIGSAYYDTTTNNKSKVTVDINTLLTDYPGAEYCRIAFDKTDGFAIVTANDFDELFRNTKLFINSPFAEKSKATLQVDGGIYTNSGYGENLKVSRILYLSELVGKRVVNAMSWTAANAYAYAVYDCNGAIIGSAQAATVSDKTTLSFNVDKTFLDGFPGAYSIRIGYDSNDGTKIVDINEIDTEPYPTYKVNAYPKIIFCGDSVTAGFVVEGTQANPQQIYEVMDEYSYPASFNRIYAGTDVTKVAQSGISIKGYYESKYPGIDFTDYDIAVFELGLNPGNEGYLNISDWNTSGTSTYIYRQMIAGVRAQDADLKIILVRSQAYSGDWLPVLEAIATESNCLVIDLTSTKYLNLNDTKYHGYYNNGGTAALDITHFNRIGYTAKAYVVAKWMGVILP